MVKGTVRLHQRNGKGVYCGRVKQLEWAIYNCGRAGTNVAVRLSLIEWRNERRMRQNGKQKIKEGERLSFVLSRAHVVETTEALKKQKKKKKKRIGENGTHVSRGGV